MEKEIEIKNLENLTYDELQKIKSLDGITYEELEKKFEWILKADIEDAEIEVKNNQLIWKYGTWNDGIWKDGIWKDGIWKKGTWKYGIWWEGTWKNGTWKAGTWKDGTWENGTWENGTWWGGTWNDGKWWNGTWIDGTWKNGIWEDGEWENGTWKDGTWENGIWWYGEWWNGEWLNGEWNNGTWIDGERYFKKINIKKQGIKEYSEIQKEISEICDNLKIFLIEKNRRYGNSALEPIRIFSKASPEEQLKVRLDDKINRMLNRLKLNKEDRKNDYVDFVGYLILFLIKKKWVKFDELID